MAAIPSFSFCDDMVDVVRLRQREYGFNIRPLIVKFRSAYDKWTVMRMKAKLRESEEYRSGFRDGSVEGRERSEKRECRRRNNWSEWHGNREDKPNSYMEEWKKDEILRSNCDGCPVNETGLTGEEYMEVSNGYTWYAANREWTKGRSGCAWIIIKEGV